MRTLTPQAHNLHQLASEIKANLPSTSTSYGGFEPASKLLSGSTSATDVNTKSNSGSDAIKKQLKISDFCKKEIENQTFKEEIRVEEMFPSQENKSNTSSNEDTLKLETHTFHSSPTHMSEEEEPSLSTDKFSDIVEKVGLSGLKHRMKDTLERTIAMNQIAFSAANQNLDFLHKFGKHSKKEEVAARVVKLLMPYYKKKKMSRENFKATARMISHKIIEELNSIGKYV